MDIPEVLVQTAKPKFDLTEPADQESLYNLVDTLLDIPDLSHDELQDVAGNRSTPLEFKIAAKLVESKKFLLANEQALKIGVVLPMWGEQNRLRPKSADNPNGEDSLRVKLQQMDWATRDSIIDWTLYAVDDGCPYGSGQLAAQIAAGHQLGKRVKVFHLAEAIPTESGPLRDLKSVDDSRKGGAIILGCLKALSDGVDAVIYTDMDNSVHLGQIGLLLQKFVENGTKAVFGDRNAPGSVVVKQEPPSIKLLVHMKRMVGQAIYSRNMLDTQAPFKLYQYDLLKKLIQTSPACDFAFDTDWILATIAMNEPFETVPFAFVDSSAESAQVKQSRMTVWETKLKKLAEQAKRHQLPRNEAMVQVLEEEINSAADLDILAYRQPPALEHVADKELGNPAIMSPEEVQAWIRHQKSSKQTK